MQRLWTIVADTVLAPTAAFRRLRHEPMPLLAIGVAAIAQAAFYLGREPINVPGQWNVPTNVGLAGEVVSGVVGLFLVAVFVHAAARILGGTGTLAGSVSGLGMAALPLVFSAPIYVLSSLIGVGIIAPLAHAVIFVWGLVLDVIAVREVHQISTARSIGALLLSIAIFVLLVIAFALLVSLFILFSQIAL